MLVARADVLTITVPVMTVLLSGLRSLNTLPDGAAHGVFTDKPGTLTNHFFVNLLDMATEWQQSEDRPDVYEGRDRVTGDLKWTATPVDLAVGSSSELRAVAEVYAADDGNELFLEDFVAAWTKVMTLDRFDLM